MQINIHLKKDTEIKLEQRNIWENQVSPITEITFTDEKGTEYEICIFGSTKVKQVKNVTITKTKETKERYI